MNDEDYFSDDATLDALAEDELQALEEEAVKSTQLQHQQQSVQYGQNDGYIQPPQYQYQNYRQGNQNAPVQAPFKAHKHLLQQPRQHSAYQKPQSYVSYSQQRQWQAPSTSQNVEKQARDRPITVPYQHPFIPPLQESNHEQHQQQQRQFEEEPDLPLSTHRTIVPDTISTLQGTISVPHKASSDYGDIDGFEESAELWDVAPPAVITPRKEVREYPVVNGGADVYQTEDWIEQQEELGQIADDVVMIDSQYDAPRQNVGEGQAYVSVRAYQIRIAQLQQEKEREKEQYELQLQKLQQAKAGEVAIVRNKLEQSKREQERIVASIHNMHAEKDEKKDAEMKAMRVEVDQSRTEVAFLKEENGELVRRNRTNSNNQKFQHDVRVQIPKSQDLAMGSTMEVEIPINRAMTPKRRNKSFVHRDGFEDEDVLFLSPSRRGKSKTPTRASLKRKRSANGSPLPQLALSQSRVMPIATERIAVIDEKVLEKLFLQDDRLEFFEALLLHRYPPTCERIFDALMMFSFPSTPNTTLSSYFLDKVTALRATAANKEFSVGISRVLLGMWSRCLEEQFFGALCLLVELFRFGILWTQGGHCNEMMDEALHLIQKTIDINAIPTATKRGASQAPGIPTVACLQVMEDMALASLGEELYIKRFWRQIRVDFPIMCLHPAQPLELIRRMVSILCTSVVNDSFGPITSSVSLQRQHETFLLDAITKPLEVVPRQPPKEVKYSATQILELRQELMQFLGCVCSIETGMLALAAHERVVPRIASRIADEVDQCYEWRLGEGVRIDFINFAVRLLHGIISSHPEEANGKLATNHKHLVSMTRLAFSEGIAQEAGLESDAIDCAFSLLENMITPDEALALEGLFNT